jgi:hypothetical protein
MKRSREINRHEREADALRAVAPDKGRGTFWAIEHRFAQQANEAFDDGWGNLDQRASEQRLPPATRIIEERAGSILSSNDSPDISFDLSVNPYRGCEHGCVSVSPIIPFINEPELERVLEAAAEAGASRAFSVVLRLPWEVNPIFQQWLEQHFPERAARVMARVRDMHGGRDYDARFGSRLKGEGVWAQLLAQRFQKTAARLGLVRQRVELDLSQFKKPLKPRFDGQQDLFS